MNDGKTTEAGQTTMVLTTRLTPPVRKGEGGGGKGTAPGLYLHQAHAFASQ